MNEELVMAKRLETYLNDLIWSQAELARRADVSVVTVRRALGDLPITRSSALKIAKAIGDEIGERLTIRDFSGLKVEAVTSKKRDTRKKSSKGE
jgi:plasmid maintenance system antidote protein VapI